MRYSQSMDGTAISALFIRLIVPFLQGLFSRPSEAPEGGQESSRSSFQAPKIDTRHFTPNGEMSRQEDFHPYSERGVEPRSPLWKTVTSSTRPHLLSQLVGQEVHKFKISILMKFGYKKDDFLFIWIIFPKKYVFAGIFWLHNEKIGFLTFFGQYWGIFGHFWVIF